MKMTKKLAALATCAVMTLSTAMSVTASAMMDTNEQNVSISETANDTYTVINSLGVYDNYAVTQVGNGSCWAACILSVLKYHDYRTTETFETIYTRANRLTSSHMSVGDAIATSKLPVVISNYLGMNAITSHNITNEQIYNHIAAQEPLIGCYYVDSNTNHDVVIYGFEGQMINGKLYITHYRIMDPSTGICSTIYRYDYLWTGYYGYSNLT